MVLSAARCFLPTCTTSRLQLSVSAESAYGLAGDAHCVGRRAQRRERLLGLPIGPIPNLSTLPFCPNCGRSHELMHTQAKREREEEKERGRPHAKEEEEEGTRQRIWNDCHRNHATASLREVSWCPHAASLEDPTLAWASGARGHPWRDWWRITQPSGRNCHMGSQSDRGTQRMVGLCRYQN